ncbi:MAG: thiamine pyrophosphate-dependent enzyme, partial [Defluviitaleaceae bacterium]|nr:thiamine pyrophosphate-dependent enzyme [Defluviitaleaceae bacterium]
MRYLDKIHSPQDLKTLSMNQLNHLSREIRRFMVNSVSKTGGHLASNLGVVELSIALHYCLDSPKDRIIWDVGHQSYVHKLLTGRKDGFSDLRQLGGLSGFPKSSESPYDSFDTGHSSTSISAAYGLAVSRDLLGADYKVVAVIGDGSLTSGLAYEGLNNVGRSKTNMIILLNDNQMSISKNVGALSKYLNRIRITPQYNDAKREIRRVLKSLPVGGIPTKRLIKKIKAQLKYMLLPGALFEEMGF